MAAVCNFPDRLSWRDILHTLNLSSAQNSTGQNEPSRVKTSVIHRQASVTGNLFNLTSFFAGIVTFPTMRKVNFASWDIGAEQMRETIPFYED
jgi:hypothetical protein